MSSRRGRRAALALASALLLAACVVAVAVPVASSGSRGSSSDGAGGTRQLAAAGSQPAVQAASGGAQRTEAGAAAGRAPPADKPACLGVPGLCDVPVGCEPPRLRVRERELQPRAQRPTAPPRAASWLARRLVTWPGTHNSASSRTPFASISESQRLTFAQQLQVRRVWGASPRPRRASRAPAD